MNDEGPRGRSLPGAVARTGIRTAERFAHATRIDDAVEVVAEEAIVRATQSEAVERALQRILAGPLVEQAVQDAVSSPSVERALREALDSEMVVSDVAGERGPYPSGLCGMGAGRSPEDRGPAT